VDNETSPPGDLAPDKPRKSNLRSPWKKGQSGNPSGRPEGLRPRVNEAFLRDMLDSWEKHGKKAIERMIDTDATGYVRVMAGLMDKHMRVTSEVDVIRTMSDEEIYARLAELRRIDTRIPALPGTTKQS
jgi:hypothetical protein